MKNKVKSNCRKTLLVVSSLLCSGLLSAVPLSKELNEGWKFKQVRLTNWYPATVPGVVHTDLINNGIIEDPFYRLNERGLQWIDKEDWIYETTFNVTPEMMNKSNLRLHFKGLDTYADVYLNDEKILEADNMFRQWHADIKNKVKAEGNVLRIYFHSPVKIDVPKWDALPFHYEATNDQSENGGLLDKKISVFARKAGYHYGWDWGPRLVTSGIWRPISLEAWNDARMEDVFFDQKQVDKKQASITTKVEVLADKDINGAKLSIVDTETGQALGTKTFDLKKGTNKVDVNFTMKNPKLWWSNGLGEAHLYNLRTDLSIDSETVDSQAKNIGVRSLKIINKPDKDGKSFYVELNGVPVFTKGANYIPSDNFLPRVTDEMYEKTILDAVNVNMNMLRVWGGGIYENDVFYDLCDKYGIMVWQDFMFACSVYPAEGKLLENIRLEAIDNVKRLRNHASIALWCGNNECQDAWFGWGWKKQYEEQNPEYAKIIYKQFTDQYYVVLPEVVKEYASETFYTPSSPFADFNVGSNDHEGDRHYWGVWHSKSPITDYNKERSRFFSEYGFQSFPEFESIKIYAPKKEDWDIYSEVMMSHQRGGAHANGLIEAYLLNEYRKPKNFQAFLYMNHVLQGDAIKTAIEAHRRDMPYCMGTLFWQHNDCWPVASWASRDYYGRWKAQHYYTRDAYRDILVSPLAEDGKLNVYVISDRLKPCTATLEVQVMKFNGEVINSYKKNVKAAANTSSKVFIADVENMLKGTPKEDVFIHATLTVKGSEPYTNNYYLVKQKELNYPKTRISHSVKPINGGFEVTLSSDKFARAAFMSIKGIDNFFENNYFDILPGQSVTTKVTTKLSQKEFEKQLKVVSLSDEY